MLIETWGYFEVTRKKIHFLKQNGISDGSELLKHILPFGNPEGKSVKYIVYNNKIFFTLLLMNRSEGEGHGLTLMFEPDFIHFNPMSLIQGMEKILSQDELKEDKLDIEQKEYPTKKISIKNFDSAIFSLLARQTTVLLGTHDEIIEILNTICCSIPQSMFKRLKFVSQSKSLSENVNIIGMPLSEDVLSELEVTKGEYTLVFIGDQVYGQFSSKFTQKIEELIKAGKFDTVKIMLEDFYTIVRKEDSLPRAIDFVEETGLHLSDAQLALIMRANYFEKEIPSILLEV